MALDLVMPWRDTGDPYRRAHFWHLRRYYERAGFRVVVGDRPGEFNRAAARNAGVKAATADVVAVLDADNVIPPANLDRAAHLAGLGGGWVKPFSKFGYLSPESTDHWYATCDAPDAPESVRLTWEGDGPQENFNGGAYVMTRLAWFLVGGMDEEFTGWGAEDDAFTIAATRVLGQPHIVPGLACHLWHPAARITSPENYRRLMEEYVNGHQPS